MDVRIEQSNLLNIFSPRTSTKSIGTSFKSMLADELTTEENFADMWQSTLESYYGTFSQNFYHVMNASISQTIWTHNDFPHYKFFANTVDESVLTWKPTRVNPSQLDSAVQRQIHATLGKNAIVVPPELDEKLKTDPTLRKKVIANIDKVCKFHTQPVPFKMHGVKEYGTKIYGAVIVLNADGEVENCAMSSGGTIMGSDEETLRQIEVERKRKLKLKEYYAELAEQAQIEYVMTREMLAMY